MQSFRKSYWVVFEIVSGADDLGRYVIWVTATRGPSPSWQRIEQKKNSQPPRRGSAGASLKVLAIRRRRACLGMPTDGAR